MISSSRKTLTSNENTATNTEAGGRIGTETVFTESTLKRKTLNRNKTSLASMGTKNLDRANRLSR
jgi:hypothetical protein